MKRVEKKILSRGFLSLLKAKTIVMIASGLLGLFLPIFLYELFNNNFLYVAFYFGVGYLLYVLFVPLGAKFLNYFGFRRALRVSIFFSSFFYVIFYFINQDNMIYLVPLSIFISLIYRIFYWVPYHTDFAKFSNKKNLGKEVSFLEAIRDIIGIFIPIVAGFIITRFGFDVLFVVAIIIYLLSGIAYLTIPETNEKFIWGYIETWKNFLSKKMIKDMGAFAANGAEEIVGMIVWPIFIFELLKGDYLKIGFIATLIIGVTVILQLFIGKYLNNEKTEEKMLKFGTIFYALGWIFKIFIATSFHIFIVDVYHNIMSVFTKTPFDALTYEISADQGHYIDEFTVLREIAINLGRSIMIVLIIAMFLFFSIQWTFILAAIASLFLNLLREKKL